MFGLRESQSHQHHKFGSPADLMFSGLTPSSYAAEQHLLTLYERKNAESSWPFPDVAWLNLMMGAAAAEMAEVVRVAAATEMVVKTLVQAALAKETVAKTLAQAAAATEMVVKILAKAQAATGMGELQFGQWKLWVLQALAGLAASRG